MKPIHMLLAVLMAVIWGSAFVATRVALDTFTPAQLTALRFIVAAVPALVVPRPQIPWRTLIATGMMLFTLLFMLQFFALANGMPPGLAAVTIQSQAFFTVLLAALVFGERPTARQYAGMLVALVGLLLISLTVGRSLTAIGLVLTLASAASWGIGNVMLKRLPKLDMFPLIVWLSLVPPLPALAVSLLLDGPASFPHALASAPPVAYGSVLFLGAFATLVAYGIWGSLLRKYPAAVVTPFALLVPIVGMAASALAFGEQFELLRLAGAAAMLLGLVIIAFPVDQFLLLRRSGSPNDGNARG